MTTEPITDAELAYLDEYVKQFNAGETFTTAQTWLKLRERLRLVEAENKLLRDVADAARNARSTTEPLLTNYVLLDAALDAHDKAKEKEPPA